MKVRVSSVLTCAGMNDVLPKPFTKEGLLHVLGKHLGHLKKPSAQIDGMPAPPPIVTTRQVLKEEESPAKSPATTSNWNSPNQVPGVSPVGTVASNVTDEYMQGGQGHAGAYAVNHMQGNHLQANPMQGNPMQANVQYSSSPQMQLQARQQQQALAGHRRQLSEISGGEDMNQPAKRQAQMYGGAPPLQPQPMNPMQRPR
jgi:osomolarity two-component system response regulator SKN7